MSWHPHHSGAFPNLRAGLAEPARRVGDREVGDHVQLVAAADAVAAHPAEDRFPVVAHRRRQPRGEDVPPALLGHRAGGLAHVAAHAEGAVAGSREHDHAHGLVVRAALEGLAQLDDRLAAEGVQPLRTVDRDGRPAPGDLVEDVLVGQVLALGRQELARVDAVLLHELREGGPHLVRVLGQVLVGDGVLTVLAQARPEVPVLVVQQAPDLAGGEVEHPGVAAVALGDLHDLLEAPGQRGLLLDEALLAHQGLRRLGLDVSGTPNALSWKSTPNFRRGRWPPASGLSSG